jgi:hypothetical protein
MRSPLRPGLRTALSVTILVAFGGPSRASAQTLVGTTVDEVRGSPVAGAIIRLLDRGEVEQAQAATDSLGRFVLAVPEAGEYYLEAVRLGYHRTRSPLLAVRGERAAEIELVMTPAPLGLRGLEVSAEAEAQKLLRNFNLSPTSLGNRWMGLDVIESVAVKRDVGSVLEWSGPPGVRVIRPENLAPGSDDLGLCVSQARGRRGAGLGTCSLIVLDGRIISNEMALDLDPLTIEAMALLTPRDATTFYGELGGGGALLLWTRRGGPVR